MSEVKKAVIEKATVANICAGAVVLVGTAYAVVSGQVELVKYIVAFALGYLFGARAVVGK